jgi:hypothetical protein
MQFCCVLPLKFKYSPQHTILSHTPYEANFHTCMKQQAKLQFYH